MSRRLVSSLALSFVLASCRASDDPAEGEIVDLAPPPAPSSVASGNVAAAQDRGPADPPANPELLAARPDERAPAEFRVALDTTKGPIEIAVHRSWSPKGADRFYTLVRRGYFVNVAFFRVVPGFMAQFGMHGNPAVNEVWRMRTIDDEPVAQSNLRGRVTFAKTGAPNSRSNQLFINFVDNANLDAMGFSPFGEVRAEDLPTVDRINAEYRERPSQGLLGQTGNAYLRAEFPNVDYVRSARVVE